MEFWFNLGWTFGNLPVYYLLRGGLSAKLNIHLKLDQVALELFQVKL